MKTCFEILEDYKDGLPVGKFPFSVFPFDKPLKTNLFIERVISDFVEQEEKENK